MTNAEASGLLPLVAVLVLLALMIQKEITTVARSHRLKRLGQMLNVAIAPLLFAFILIAISMISEVFK